MQNINKFEGNLANLATLTIGATNLHWVATKPITEIAEDPELRLILTGSTNLGSAASVHRDGPYSPDLSYLSGSNVIRSLTTPGRLKHVLTANDISSVRYKTGWFFGSNGSSFRRHWPVALFDFSIVAVPQASQMMNPVGTSKKPTETQLICATGQGGYGYGWPFLNRREFRMCGYSAVAV